jgi:hypothetical protein
MFGASLPLTVSPIAYHVIVIDPLFNTTPESDDDSLTIPLGIHMWPAVCQALSWKFKNK